MSQVLKTVFIWTVMAQKNRHTRAGSFSTTFCVNL